MAIIPATDLKPYQEKEKDLSPAETKRVIEKLQKSLADMTGQLTQAMYDVDEYSKRTKKAETQRDELSAAYVKSMVNDAMREHSGGKKDASMEAMHKNMMDMSAKMTAAMNAMAQAMSGMNRHITVPAPVVNVPDVKIPAPADYAFDFTYDDEGRISGATARVK